jgi:hypothetical protein
MATDQIGAVKAYAHNMNVAKTIQQMLKMSREDVEPEQQKQQDFLDKHIAATLAKVVTGFGA